MRRFSWRELASFWRTASLAFVASSVSCFWMLDNSIIRFCNARQWRVRTNSRPCRSVLRAFPLGPWLHRIRHPRARFFLPGQIKSLIEQIYRAGHRLSPFCRISCRQPKKAGCAGYCLPRASLRKRAQIHIQEGRQEVSSPRFPGLRSFRK